LLTGFLDLGPWMPVGIVGLLLAISGPSMFIAWLKLRTRNLGPVLDANGWAVNTLTRVNIPLGGSLTELPRIPAGSHRTLVDPYAPKKSIWPRLLLVLMLLAGTGYVLYRTNLLHKWLPDYVPAHHTELGLLFDGDKKSGTAGEKVAFKVRSAAQKLLVTNVTDSNQPVPMADLPVADGKAVLAIPADCPPGTLKVFDAVSETELAVEVTAPPPK
jgi:hypothetical protein